MKLTPDAGRRLWEARERKGLTRAALEQLTSDNGFKVSEATIFNIENGVSKAPYPRNIYALADALGVDSTSLFVAEVPA